MLMSNLVSELIWVDAPIYQFLLDESILVLQRKSSILHDLDLIFDFVGMSSEPVSSLFKQRLLSSSLYCIWYGLKEYHKGLPAFEPLLVHVHSRIETFRDVNFGINIDDFIILRLEDFNSLLRMLSVPILLKQGKCSKVVIWL